MRLFLVNKMMNTITAITQQKRNPQRVNIYLDGAFAFPLAKIVAAWLKVGQTLSPDKIAELQTQDGEEAALQRALHFLSYRPRSIAEVQRQLRRHKVAEQHIAAVVQRLQAGRLLDDPAFAQRWVEDRAAFRPRGARALRAELRLKGMPDAVIEESLQGLDEHALATQAAQKKMRSLQNLDWDSFRSKLAAHLARRGFAYETCAEVCREAWLSIHPGNEVVTDGE
jgi:regulatory protein